MGNPAFSLLHATARPWGWENACQRFRLMADDPSRCEYVLGIHRRQSELPGRQPEFHAYHSRVSRVLRQYWNVNGGYGPIVSINPGRPCVVDNANMMAACSSGDILIGIADGLRPCPHWDTELLKAIDDVKKPYLIRTSHGEYLPETWIVTHGIMTRALYEKWGYVAWPEYLHFGCDDDTTLMAQRDGVILDARHLNFPYSHWSTGTRTPDQITKHNNESGAWQIKEEVLKRRIASNFLGKVRYGCVPE
jgi:hypothetical protein